MAKNVHKIVLSALFHLADAPSSSMLPVLSIKHAKDTRMAP